MFGDYGHAGDPSETGRLRVARYVLRKVAKVKLGLPRPPAPALAPPAPWALLRDQGLTRSVTGITLGIEPAFSGPTPTRILRRGDPDHVASYPRPDPRGSQPPWRPACRGRRPFAQSQHPLA